MSTIDRYQRQLQLLADMKQKLVNLRSQMDQSLNTYGQFLAAAETQAFMQNYTETLGARKKQLEQLVNQLHETMNRNLALIQRHEGGIQGNIASARG